MCIRILVSVDCSRMSSILLHQIFCFFGICDFDLTVDWLFVHILHFWLSLIIQWREDELIIVLKRLTLQLLSDLRVLREHIIVKVTFHKGKCAHFPIKCHVYELTFTIIEYVVITYQVILLGMAARSWIKATDESLTDGIVCTGKSICNKWEGYSNDAFLDEVHLWYILLLIINNPVIVIWIELARQEAKCNIIKEVHLVRRVHFEEAAEL